MLLHLRGFSISKPWECQSELFVSCKDIGIGVDDVKICINAIIVVSTLIYDEGIIWILVLLVYCDMWNMVSIQNTCTIDKAM